MTRDSQRRGCQARDGGVQHPILCNSCTLPRTLRHPASSHCPNFKAGETQKGGGGEQGTEIKREGQGPAPPGSPEAALRQAALGSRTGGIRPSAGESQGQEDRQA